MLIYTHVYTNAGAWITKRWVIRRVTNILYICVLFICICIRMHIQRRYTHVTVRSWQRCVCVYVYTHMFVCVYIYMNTHMFVCVYIYMCPIHMHMYPYVYPTSIHTRDCKVVTNVCVCVFIHTHVCMCIHMYLIQVPGAQNAGRSQECALYQRLMPREWGR